MFNFDYLKAKKTFRTGLIMMFVGLVTALVFIIPIVLILKLVKDASAVLVFILIVIAICIAIVAVIGIVFTVYGGVVYHAERTATRDIKEIDKNVTNAVSEIKPVKK